MSKLPDLPEKETSCVYCNGWAYDGGFMHDKNCYMLLIQDENFLREMREIIEEEKKEDEWYYRRRE